jgi:hypothetical protein
MIQQGNLKVDQPGYNAPDRQNYQQGNNNPNNPPNVVNNQLDFEVKTSIYLSRPMLCHFCNTTVNTNVKKKCSCANICCCLWFGPLIWVCFQCCRKKQISCNDITHECPKCNQPLIFQEAC